MMSIKVGNQGIKILLKCLLGMVISLLLVSQLYAAQGVGLIYSSTLASIGGGGGNAFGNITCPAGQLITGFNFWNSNSGGSLDGVAIQGRCSTLSISGSTPNLSYTGNTAVGGSAGGTVYTGNCPAGQVVTGVDAQATTWPVLGWFRLYCSSISYNSSTKLISIDAAPASPSTGIIGPSYGYGGTYYNRVVAPTGSAIAGFSGRSGAALDQVNFNAYTITQSSLTLTANVTGGSATASAFTLKATDTSSIATNFTSGSTNIMTPSTYTLSWTGPSGYTLTSITNCSNPVTLSNSGVADCYYNFSYAPSISGNVYLDSAGTGAASTTGISGVTVRLYNSAGTFITSTTTNASGAYSFSNQTAGTYYITVAAPTSGSAVSEQTYATTGTNNDGTAGGSGYGPICVGDTPTYTPQSSTTPSAWSAQSSDGTCFGGRRGSVADTNNTTLTQNEHVTRVVTSATGSDVSDVNFGFSYNVVTNVNDTGQGSLRQFITNANTLTGANAMRFVPAVATNQSSGGNAWWKTTLASVLPTLTGANAANTTIDGTAYSNIDGTTLLTPNTATINADKIVGYGNSQSTIPALSGPQLEINAPTTSGFNQTLGIAAASNIIQNVSVTGGYSNTIFATTGSSSFTLQNSVVGMTPVGTDSTQSQPGAQNAGIRVGDLAGSATTAGLSGNIYHNAIRSTGANISFYGLTGLTSGQYTISNNFALGVTGTNINGIDILSSPNVNLTSNYVTSSKGSNIHINASNGCIATGNTSQNSGAGPNFYFNSATSNAKAIGNVFQSATGYGMRIDSSSNNNLVQANQIINNASGALAITSNSNGNKITQNIFGGNSRNAIDLNSDGVSLNSSACLNTAGSTTGNSGLARPVINSMNLSGSTLTLSGTMCATGTFTIEVYKAVGNGLATGSANNDMGSDNQLAGEGTVYLGSFSSQSGGSFSGSLTVSGISQTDSISVIAIRTVTGGTGVVGDTSEFSINAGFSQLQGTIFEDVNGDQGIPVGRSGVNVCAFLDGGDGIPNATDSLLSCTTTAADGTYSISTPINGTYWVAVQASTVTPSQGGSGVPEQVYGPIGGQCTNSSFAATTLTSAGPCYGGKTPATADAFAGTAATLANAKHLAKVVVNSADTSHLDFGFSFNVVTNVNDAGQGSFRQFLTNANGITGANTMRFVPAVATNQSNGSNKWWRVTTTTTLPTVTGAAGANTTIDGKAYSNADGVSVVNSNSVILGDTVTQVGRTTSALTGVEGPELEIKGSGIVLAAASPTLENVAVFGGGISVAGGASSVIIQDNIIGSGAGALADPGSGSRQSFGVTVDFTTVTTLNGLTIQNNIITYSRFAGINLNNINTYNNLIIKDNQISTNSLESSADDGLQIVNVPNFTGTASIDHNLFKSNNNKGIELYTIGGPLSVVNNTFLSNGLVGTYASPAIGLLKSTNSLVTVQDNIFTSNGGPGVYINNNGSNNRANLISKNLFSGNGGNAIDLGGDGVTLNSTSCLNVNTASSANTGLARPVITGATIDSGNLNIQGTMCSTGSFDIQVYKATSGTGDTGTDSQAAGEGSVYLGTISASGGNFSGSLAATGLALGDKLTAIAIRTTTGGLGLVGDTSEFTANVAITNANFGSAPDSYKTLKASGGAEHYPSTLLSIGTVVPTATDGSPVTAPAAAAGGDGITLPLPTFTLATTSYSVSVKVTNLSNVNATLIGWIDVNRDGNFSSAEAATATVPAGTNNGTVTLTWSNISSLNPTLGATYLRLRLSTSSLLTTSYSDGILPNGEVEDYGGTGVLEIIGRDILGTVYKDINNNGIYEGTESGSGQTLYAKLLSRNGNTCGSTVQQVVAVNTSTGQYQLVGAAPGDYCVVIDNNNTLTDVTPTLPSHWHFTQSGTGTRFVSVSALANTLNVNFGINNDSFIRGRVFYDTAATAYDGIQQTDEVGIANVSVTLTGDTGTMTTTTAADGSFYVSVPSTVSSGSGNITALLTAPAGTLSVSKSVSTYTDLSAVTLTKSIKIAASNMLLNGEMRFGVAQALNFQPNQVVSAEPGSSVFLLHRVKAPAAGTLKIWNSDSSSHPVNANWTNTLYLDADCNGKYSTGDSLLPSTITVPAGGGTICILNKVTIPSNAQTGEQLLNTLTAQFDYGTSGISSLSTVQENIQAGKGTGLKLEKTVDKNTVKVGSNAILTYQVSYINLSNSSMNNITIYDYVPDYTTLKSGSAACVTPLPSGITCNVDISNLPSIKWKLTGNLAAGDSGKVTYQVIIN